MEDINLKVAYVCYGSNKAEDRFQEYLDCCDDTTMPSEQYHCIIPYEMYFAGYSRKWDGAPAFIDVAEDAHFATSCRVYIITREQYGTIKEREGNQYTNEIKLGKIKGYEAVTFTSPKSKAQWGGARSISSSLKYIETIKKGELQCQELELVEIEYI